MADFKHKGWDELFEHNKNRWKKPNEYVHLLSNKLKDQFKDKAHVLDIGYGTGRHILYFHQKGCLVSGFDIASNAKKYAKEIISTISDEIDLKVFDMSQTPWPYKPNSFEGALAINVIHHTNYNNFVKIINEISRILVKNGLFLATIASKQNHKFGKGDKIDEYTYLTDSGAEKGIPHCFLDNKDITKIFSPKFHLLKLELISGEIPEEDKPLKKEGSLDHWLIFAQKK